MLGSTHLAESVRYCNISATTFCVSHGKHAQRFQSLNLVHPQRIPRLFQKSIEHAVPILEKLLIIIPKSLYR